MRVAGVIAWLLLAGCTGVGPLPSFPDASCATTPDVRTDAGYAVYGHSHNDYQQARPLLDALDNHFYSVEADLWLEGPSIVVSHTAFTNKGTLKALYLDPLQARVDQLGSVYGDGVQVVLWLDIKDGSQQLREALAKELEPYSMFTVFGEGARAGPVVAILTGDARSKRAFVDGATTRKACRDADDLAFADPPVDDRWCAYAISYGTYFTWGGQGAMPADQVERLQCLVADAHAKGRRLRIYASPESTDYWTRALAAGLDFINTDDLPGLHAFLARQ